MVKCPAQGPQVSTAQGPQLSTDGGRELSSDSATRTPALPHGMPTLLHQLDSGAESSNLAPRQRGERATAHSDSPAVAVMHP